MSVISSSFPTPLPTRPTSPISVDPRQITNASQITAQLAIIFRREAEVSLALNALVADRSQIEGALIHLRQLGSSVDRIALVVDGGTGANGLQLEQNGSVFLDDDDRELVGRVRRVWETSERVGGKVRRLDDEVGRVREAADIVTEVLELKVRAHCRPPSLLLIKRRTRCKHCPLRSPSRTGNLHLEHVEGPCLYGKKSSKVDLQGLSL